jgi:hypothetical protein
LYRVRTLSPTSMAPRVLPLPLLLLLLRPPLLLLATEPPPPPPPPPRSLDVRLEPTAVAMDSAGDAATVRVRVAPLEGAAAVVLSKLTFMPASDEQSVVAGAAGTALSCEGPAAGDATGASICSIDFSSLFSATQPPRGLYRLDLAISAPAARAAGAPSAASVVVKVNTAIEPVDFNITTAWRDAAGQAAEEELLEFAAQHPAAVPETVALSGAAAMTVEFRVRSRDDGSYMQPHQAMVHLTSDSGQNRPIVLVATPREDDPDALQAKLDVAAQDLAGHAGDYTMQVVVGDFFAQNAIVWNVATVAFAPRRDNATGVTAPPPRGLQPVIRHSFRDPEPTPVPLLSSAFAAAALAPGVFLLFALARSGANLGGCARMGAGRVAAAVGFHVCTAAMLYLTVAFWLSGTLRDTAAKLVPLAVASVLLGWAALREAEPVGSNKAASDEASSKPKTE